MASRNVGLSGGTTAQGVKTPTGLPYGEAGQLAGDQAQMPLPAQSPIPTPPSTSGPGTPPVAAPGGVPGAPGGANNFAQVLAAAANMPPPGPGLGAPTARPNEPVTAGLPGGPGPGPEALNLPAPGVGTAGTLQLLAQATGSPLLAKLATTALTQGS